MSIAKETLSRFEETVNGYIRDLEGTSMDQLLWKPAEDEWSLGQMYMHLIRSARFMHLRNVALCLDPNGSPEVTQAGKTEQGEKVFKMGSFPPIRIRVAPSPQYTPPQPESKEQIVDGLRDALRRMAEIEPAVTAAFEPDHPVRSESGKAIARHTVLHPQFGGLNALEWFRLAEMHYRHHLRQKSRLDDAWRVAHA
ncbi:MULTISPECIES: DinB family protein [Paenibacillaceae]|jgi:hypothetical protein|uniref:DinB-like domain-containing protein n=2 Tax=Paenibacillaceae TaxID=186822 RepID=L0E9D1_THECK|nr:MULTISPECIES: DinB family protein [Paenibacillaceae]AGA56362.1 hypothetical protein Theco_0112 [Thermobacillus composti KWC4]MBU5445664.1 DinB family protein [Paenibacillus sp. MSJ-34]REJ21248.1 MAG: DinB family protein [Paenibacillaceae bacterium]GIQ62363.1 hypothetical protein PACILC2_09310 [Paenibacillus cisolokensis]